MDNADQRMVIRNQGNAILGSIVAVVFVGIYVALDIPRVWAPSSWFVPTRFGWPEVAQTLFLATLSPFGRCR